MGKINSLGLSILFTGEKGEKKGKEETTKPL